MSLPDNADGLSEAYIRKGLPVPAHLVRPQLLPGAANLIGVFSELSTNRMGGEGILPIPTSSILAYCQTFLPGDPDGAGEMVRMIRKIDSVWMECVEAKPKGTVDPSANVMDTFSSFFGK